MIIIRTYSEIDKQHWKSLAETSSFACWFQTDEAYHFYASVSEILPFITAVENNGKLRAVCLGYITKETNVIKQYLTCRAIIVGGPLLADDATDEEVSALLMAVKECKVEGVKCKGAGDEFIDESLKVKGAENSEADTPLLISLSPHRLMKPIYIESRNFHDYSKWKSVFQANGFTYQPHLNIQVVCNANHTMSEQRQRQVKKAIKCGAEICEASSEQEIRDWYQILRQLYRKKVCTPLWSEAFFLEFYRNGVGKYLLVKYEGKVIGGMMCPVFANKAIYEWYVCGLDEEYKEQYPSVMATYAAIEYAKAHGIQLFDFMGAGQPDVPYGVRDFKMEFGGEMVGYGRYVCIRKPLLYKIGKLGVGLLKKRIVNKMI